jgi:N-acetylmuramoyl-L-alanine amidase
MDAERRRQHSGCDDVVRAIEAYHVDSNGWRGIAYSWLYCQHGHVYEGRGWDAMTAATLGHNDHTQAVCFLGPDVRNRDDLTKRGREAAAYLTNQFLDRYGKHRRISGHREFGPTTCPGAEITAWIAARGWLVDDPDHKA